MRGFGRTASIAAVLLSLTGMAGAADIRVLSVDAVEPAVRSLAADFAKESGHQVIFTIGSPAVVAQKIKDGEVFDAVIVSEPAMDLLDGNGMVNPESRVRLAMPAWAWRCARVRQSRTSRRRRPSSRYCWRQSRSSMVMRDCPTRAARRRRKSSTLAGLLETLKPKIQVVPRQAASHELIAKGEVEIGLYDVNEIPEGKGLTFAGPVPAPLQIATTYEGALLTDGAVSEAARAFVRFLASADARDTWIAARLEPLEDR